MSLADNKALTRRVLEAAFNECNLDALDDGFTADAVIHDPGLELRGPVELARGLTALRTVFPDFHFTVDTQLAEGDLVAVRYHAEGTQQAAFLGVAASGRRVRCSGMVMLRLEHGRIAEMWADPDQLGLLKQLGAHAE